MKNSFLLFLTFTFFLTGCATEAARKELVLKRASFDLECPPDKLVSTDIDNSTFGIQGCGKKGVYIVDCQGNSNISACRAILNSQPIK